MIRGAAATVTAAGIAASGLASPATSHAASPRTETYPYALSARFAPLPFPQATVLTIEAAFIGLQPFVRSIPKQLNESLCKSPSLCQPVDYFAFPGGEAFNDAGADQVLKAIAKLPADTKIMLAGGSQGGEVVYSTLRKWGANPAIAPDPSRVTWLAFGNPENRYGGEAVKSRGKYAGREMRPLDSPYKGIEVIRQYDGWADHPDDPNNFLALLNAAAGQLTTHVSGYSDVDLNDPDNVIYTPNNPDGSPGNVTYVYVPTAILPLVDGLGFLSPILDKLLRPGIEKGYNRPVQLPDPNAPVQAPASAAVAATARVAPATAATSVKPLSIAAPDLPKKDLPKVNVPAEVQVETGGDAPAPPFQAPASAAVAATARVARAAAATSVKPLSIAAPDLPKKDLPKVNLRAEVQAETGGDAPVNNEKPRISRSAVKKAAAPR
jgi:hypothetical protein